MKIIKLKQNKGISITDITIAVVILLMFIGIIGQTFNLIASNNLKMRANAIAMYYIVKLAEDIDKMPYDDVTQEYLEEILADKDEYDYSDDYEINVEIDNYKEMKNGGNLEGPIQEDVIKIITIKAKYEVYNKEQTINVKKLKIKEQSI